MAVTASKLGVAVPVRATTPTIESLERDYKIPNEQVSVVFSDQQEEVVVLVESRKILWIVVPAVNVDGVIKVGVLNYTILINPWMRYMGHVRHVVCTKHDNAWVGRPRVTNREGDFVREVVQRHRFVVRQGNT